MPELLRHLLILDLDETLVHGTEAQLSYPPDFHAGAFSVYKRPHLDLFVATVRDWFDLAVWTNSSRNYAEVVVAHVFPSTSLRFFWSGDRTTMRYDSELQTRHTVKDLKKVRRAGFDLKRVLMVDDTPGNLRRHYGNHIRVSEFTGDAADAELRELLPFLDWIRSVPNVRTVEKRTWRSHGSAPA